MLEMFALFFVVRTLKARCKLKGRSQWWAGLAPLLWFIGEIGGAVVGLAMGLDLGIVLMAILGAITGGVTAWFVVNGLPPLGDAEPDTAPLRDAIARAEAPAEARENPWSAS